ncbi:NUDIX domain-containing protein [Streptomyces sp. NPDC048603]|uniref:NUDIX domain-containing protein n=1 Tax=Streptomyces sp. NPDC048603 TaxID=3365577 RepID=UPI00371A82A7
MSRIRTAATGLVVRDGHVLLVKGDWPEPDTWLPPGGGQKLGEPLHRAVEREVLEETGVTVRAGQLLFLREHIPANHEAGPIAYDRNHRVDALFWCEVVSEPFKLGGSIPDPTHTGVEWVPLDKVGGLRMIPLYLRDQLTHVVAQAAAGTWQTLYLGDMA